MGKELDDLISLGLMGAAGYLAGAATYKGFEGMLKGFNDRFETLRRMQITIPYGLFKTNPDAQKIYRQGVLAHLFGLSDASVPMTVRVLELALKQNYKEKVGKESPSKLVDLIDWAEPLLGLRHGIAQSWRIIRNLIHGQELVTDMMAMDAIRHVSDIVNLLYPFESASIPTTCPTCGGPQGTYYAPRHLALLGSNVKLECHIRGFHIYDFRFFP
jgi:hypothetical protein